MENKIVLESNVNKREFLAKIANQIANQKPKTQTSLKIGEGLSQREALEIVKQTQKDKQIKVSDEALIEFAKVLQKEVNTKVGDIKQAFDGDCGITVKRKPYPIDFKAAWSFGRCNPREG